MPKHVVNRKPAAEDDPTASWRSFPLRPADPKDPQDLPAILRLKLEARRRLWPDVAPMEADNASLELRRRYRGYLTTPEHQLLVAVGPRPVTPPMVDEESPLVGFVLICPNPHPRAEHIGTYPLWLQALYSHPGLERRGIARLLLNAALAYASGRGQGLVSWSLGGNHKLHQLYATSGGQLLAEDLPDGLHPDLPVQPASRHLAYGWPVPLPVG